MSTYRIGKEIGRGGMAVVYAGWHEQLDRAVALKVLADHLAGNEGFRTRFLREARIAARLHHPNLVRTYDIARIDGRPCIVMELVTGGTLEDGRLTRAEAARVAEGLAYAHDQGVVHRDLKPANLLRAGGDTVKIADFGIARAAEETMVTEVGTVLGTLRYLSPEQAAGRVVGPEADVYSLGVVLDELLADREPSDADLIARCRAEEPAERPTAAEVAAELGGDTAVASTHISHAPTLHRSGARHLVAVALALAAVVVAAIAVAVATNGSGGPAKVRPVPHAATAGQQARNLRAWLEQYSR